MVIGIGGVSRSGKTSLSELIKKHFVLKNDTVVVLHQDAFVFAENQIPKIVHDGETIVDWECPESIDFQRFKNEIELSKTQYQHVITEGLLNFYDTPTNTLFDKFLFVEISKSTFLKRRIADKRWFQNEPAWFIEHVWESYERYGRTIFDQQNAAVLTLSGETNFDEKRVFDFLKK